MTMCYVGVQPCGCVTAAAVDEPEYAKDNAKTVAGWIRKGLTVERCDTEDARARLALGWPDSCPHDTKANS